MGKEGIVMDEYTRYIENVYLDCERLSAQLASPDVKITDYTAPEYRRPWNDRMWRMNFAEKGR